MYPGFGKAPQKLTFCENVDDFLGRPEIHDVFTKDCELSSAQTHSTPQIIDINGIKTEVVVRRSICAGVKVCGAPDCTYTVSTAQRRNRCRLHGETHALVRSGECSANIFNVRPKEEGDRRRWIATISLQEGDEIYTTTPGRVLESYRLQS